MINLNNPNLKNITEDLLDTFLRAGTIAKKISQRGLKVTINQEFDNWVEIKLLDGKEGWVEDKELRLIK